MTAGKLILGIFGMLIVITILNGAIWCYEINNHVVEETCKVEHLSFIRDNVAVEVSGNLFGIEGKSFFQINYAKRGEHGIQFFSDRLESKNVYIREENVLFPKREVYYIKMTGNLTGLTCGKYHDRTVYVVPIGTVVSGSNIDLK